MYHATNRFLSESGAVNPTTAGHYLYYLQSVQDGEEEGLSKALVVLMF